MSLIMPPNTVYVTILRNPIAMFESMYGYYDLEKFYKFKFEWFDLKNLTRLPNMSKRFANRIGLNQMFFDLGFNLRNSNAINYRPYIEYLDSIFDLVMIEEFMDESIVLLKNLLCWSTDDAVAFKVNARIRKQEVGDLAIERIQYLNQADVKLYEHFLEKFKQKIASMDKQTLDSELEELKDRRKYWFDECVDTTRHSRSNIVQFNVKKDNLTCRLLTAKELELTKLIRDHQLKLYPDSIYTSIFQRTRITWS